MCNTKFRRGKYPVKRMSPEDGKRVNIDSFPNFSATGSVMGMKNLYYGLDAKLVRCGAYIYNVSSKPEIYDNLP